jgi:hypothetical protein
MPHVNTSIYIYIYIYIKQKTEETGCEQTEGFAACQTMNDDLILILGILISDVIFLFHSFLKSQIY